MKHVSFPPVWIGFGLGHYRLCHQTYCRYDHQKLPPLPQYLFDGSLNWLLCHPSRLTFDSRFAEGWGGLALAAYNERAERAQPELLRMARDCGLPLPDLFLRFLFDGDLVTRFRSPTDCYFRLPIRLTHNPGPLGGHFIHFLSDSQNCYEWYLFMDPSGNHCVVASYADLASERLPENFWANNQGEITFCAAPFEAFLFRLWIENEIWFRLVEKDQPLTSEMEMYLGFSKEWSQHEEKNP
jgi:hypothetical protein